MIIRFRDEPVVDAGEFAVDAEELRGLDVCTGCGCGVEGPAVGVGDEFVALGEGGAGGGVGGEPEEDVVGCDGEVEDYVAVFIFVATCDVAVECFPSLANLPTPLSLCVNVPFFDFNHTISSGFTPFRGTIPYH